MQKPSRSGPACFQGIVVTTAHKSGRPPLNHSLSACERSSRNSHLIRLPVFVTLEATVFSCELQHSASSTGGSHGDEMSSARLACYAIAHKCGLIFMHFSGIFLCQTVVLRHTGSAHCPVCQKCNNRSLCLKQRNIRRCCATRL